MDVNVMKHGAVSDKHIILNDDPAVRVDMNNGIVLNIRTVADGNRTTIGTDHNTWPDETKISDSNLTDNCCIGMDKGISRNNGTFACNFIDRHRLLSAPDLIFAGPGFNIDLQRL